MLYEFFALNSVNYKNILSLKIKNGYSFWNDMVGRTMA